MFDDDGEWHLANGNTPSEGTGPNYDSDGNGKKIARSPFTHKKKVNCILPVDKKSRVDSHN